MIYKILEIQENRGKHCVTYQFVSDSGEVIGPTMDSRDIDEDHDAWLQGMLPSETPDPQPTPEELLLQDIASYSDEVVQNVLGTTPLEIQSSFESAQLSVSKQTR